MNGLRIRVCVASPVERDLPRASQLHTFSRVKQTTYRVLPALRGWKILADDVGRVLSLHETKEEAIKLAEVLARHDGRVSILDGVPEDIDPES